MDLLTLAKCCGDIQDVKSLRFMANFMNCHTGFNGNNNKPWNPADEFSWSGLIAWKLVDWNEKVLNILGWACNSMINSSSTRNLIIVVN